MCNRARGTTWTIAAIRPVRHRYCLKLTFLLLGPCETSKAFSFPNSQYQALEKVYQINVVLFYLQ